MVRNYYQDSVTFINGTTGQSNNDGHQFYIGDNTVPFSVNPNTASGVYNHTVSSGEIMFTNIALGESRLGKYNYTTSNYTPSNPSGYSSAGVGTYGDGQKDTNTSFGIESGVAGHVVWNYGPTVSTKKNTELT